jgi:putative membrane-bound dehydrogenase-like protein
VRITTAIRGTCVAALGLALGATAQVDKDIDFTIAEGFQLETVLREPEVRQPLSINFDERGRMWIAQYLQFPFPQGLKVIGHDNYWRVQYENFPPTAPPNHEIGKDIVSVHEDTDGDGSFDKHTEFVTGLSITTSALPGRGGVWIMNPPYLLFYPDANRDDVPDGDPEVHLAGFGLEDLHAVANGLRWGPDGWLYGYQGSTTTATVTVPGTDAPPLHFKGQNLWRYNTEDRRFELFAEGGHNHFGIAMDTEGRMFTGSNGGRIGFHQVQGGYTWKSWAKHGELTNPYAYGFYMGIEDHSTRAKLSQGLVSYRAPNFPAEFQDAIFTLRALKRCVSVASLKPKGSTFSAHEFLQLMETDDQHFRPVAMAQGPDGALYVADWHDTNITWSVSAETDRILRETGRIYRVTHGANVPYTPFDFSEASSERLVELLGHPNKWYREIALRILYDREDTAIIPALEKILWQKDVIDPMALQALWALNASGGFTMQLAEKALDHPHPQVRLWTLRLLANDHTISTLISHKLVAMGTTEPDAQVRSQLASTAKRLKPAEGLPVVLAMMRSGRDVKDEHIPLLLWWAVEQHIRQDAGAVVAWAKEASAAQSAIFDNTIVTRLAQRFAQDRKDEDFNACAALLAGFSAPAHRQSLLAGMAKGLGRGTNAKVPAALNEELAAMLEADPGNTQLLIIAARLGNTDVYTKATEMIADTAVAKGQRLALIKLLGEEKHGPAKNVLLQLFQGTEGDDIRGGALAAVQGFAAQEVGEALLGTIKKGDSLKGRIASALVSRVTWATALLTAVDVGDIPAADVDRVLLTNLAAQNDPAIDALVLKHWGAIRSSPDEKMGLVNAISSKIKNGPGYARAGIKIYEENCGKCHVHLGIGRQVGPEMTGLNRKDRWDFVTNVVDPSRSVLPEYTGTTFTILGEDDGLGVSEQTITGFMLRESDAEIMLIDSAGTEMVVPRDKVKSMEPMALSVMPEGLVSDMSDQELRDLFAFIQADTMPPAE